MSAVDAPAAAPVVPVQTKSAADQLAEQFLEVGTVVKSLAGDVASLKMQLADATKANRPAFDPGTAPNVAVGMMENSISRPISIFRVVRAIKDPARYLNLAKVEKNISDRIQAQLGYDTPNAWSLPFDSRKLVVEDSEEAKVAHEKGQPRNWITKDLYDECVGRARMDIRNADIDGMLQKMGNVQRKDLIVGTSTTGGAFREAAGLGEMIDFLRPLEIFSTAGVPEITLPKSGRISFPRWDLDPLADAYAESGTITETTTTNMTSTADLSAKKYASLIDVTDEMLAFASIDVEAWLRMAMAAELALNFDQDQIVGAASSNNTAGWITKTNVNNYTTLTYQGANGNSLSVEDGFKMLAMVEADSVQVRKFAWAVHPTLWGGLMGRRAASTTDTAAARADAAATNAGPLLVQMMANFFGRGPETWAGWPVIKSANVPVNRVKASGSNLTLVLGFEANEWIIGRHGVVEFAMTNSHASNFAVGINSVRAFIFQDATSKHDQGGVFADYLLNG